MNRERELSATNAEATMKGPMILVAVAMILTFVSHFYPNADQRPRSPVEVYFHGGYWVTSLTRTGQVLLIAGWVLAIVALFWALSELEFLRWQNG